MKKLIGCYVGSFNPFHEGISLSDAIENIKDNVKDDAERNQAERDAERYYGNDY